MKQLSFIYPRFLRCLSVIGTLMFHYPVQAQDSRQAFQHKNSSALLTQPESSATRFVNGTGDDFDEYLFRKDVANGRATYTVPIDNVCTSLLEFDAEGFPTNVGELAEAGVFPEEARLTLRVFDVDHNTVVDANQDGIADPMEVDHVYVNGNLLTEPNGNPWRLESGNNVWSVISVNIPLNYLKFPQSQGGEPAINTIEIEIDVERFDLFCSDIADCEGWAVTCDWISIDLLTQDLVEPIVLVHGWQGDGNSFETFANWFERDKIPHHIAVLQGEGSIVDNARLLNQQINDFLDNSCYEKVNILAHSKGGLDTRAYIRTYGGEKVNTVVQLGTPNHGSKLADALKFYHENKSWNPFLNFKIGIGLSTNNLTQEDLNKLDTEFGLTEAVKNLTVEFMEEKFNYQYGTRPSIKDGAPIPTRVGPLYDEHTKGVDFFVFAGNLIDDPSDTEDNSFEKASKASFYLGGSIIGPSLEEPNDGIVPLVSTSLPWKCYPDSYDDGVLTCQGYDGVFSRSHSSIKKAEEVYQGILPLLVGSNPVKAKKPLFHNSPFLATNQRISPKDSLRENLHYEFFALLEKDSSQNFNLKLPQAEISEIVVDASTDSLSFTLEGPNGQSYSSSQASVKSSAFGWQSTLQLPNIPEGTYSLSVNSGTDVGGMVIQVKTYSQFLLDAAVERREKNSLTVSASLRDSNVLIQNLSMEANLYGALQFSDSIPLLDDGLSEPQANDGVFGNTFLGPIEEEILTLVVTATWDSIPFIHRQSIPYKALFGTFNDQFRERQIRDDFSFLYDSVEIQVGIDLLEPRRFLLTADLLTGDSLYVGTAASTFQVEDLEEGSGFYSIYFDGLDIGRSGYSGNFLLSNLQLIDLQTGEFADTSSYPLRTNFYRTSSFPRPFFELNEEKSYLAEDTDNNGLYNHLDFFLEFEVAQAGSYSLSAQLVDSSNQSINWTEGNIFLGRGTRSIQLRFDGLEVNQSRLSGAYTLTNFSIYNEASGIISNFYDVYTTEAFEFNEFEGLGIEGFIQTPEGDPLPQVKLFLGGTQLANTETDSLGRFYFAGLVQGAYTLTVDSTVSCDSSTYTLDLTSTNEITLTCESNVVSERQTLGLAHAKFRVFPSPVSETLFVKNQTQKSGIGEVIISNLMGQTVYRKQVLFHSGEKAHSIPIQSLSPGNYIVQIRLGQEQFYSRVTID